VSLLPPPPAAANGHLRVRGTTKQLRHHVKTV
jgi:hypothetical protein